MAAIPSKTFASLPPDVVEHLAYTIGTSERFECPRDLLSLQLLCRSVYRVVAPKHAPALYARLFEWKFDSAAPKRRFKGIDASILGAEYLSRLACLTRMRSFARRNELSYDRNAIARDLWTAYLMAIENDTKNMDQLRKHGMIETYLDLYYQQYLFKATLEDGYVPDNVDRSLAMHLIYLTATNEQLDNESSDTADERFYVLKSFVFAAHQYSAQYAPWNIRTLPQPKHAFATDIPVPGTQETVRMPMLHYAFGELDAPPNQPMFHANLTPIQRISRIHYMGRPLSIAPPLLFIGACLSFELRVDRDPEVSGANAAAQMLNFMSDIQESNGLATRGNQVIVDADGRPMSAAAVRAIHSAALATSRATSTPQPMLESRQYDFDFDRLLSCSDPFSVQSGMTVAQLRGKFQGTYEGRFSFFDFESYREMLGGRRRSLFEGPFRAQPQVWRIEEVVVRLDDANVNDRFVEGGLGPILNAGFPTARSAPLNEALFADLQDAPVIENSFDSPVSRLAEKNLDIRKNIAAGQVLSPTTKLDPTKRYEILLSGSGHSAWGSFVLKGRVRTWDGLFSLAKEYTPDGRGRWLYRGYSMVNSNILLGRWRDTFTPEHMNGYEGTFVMSRRR